MTGYGSSSFQLSSDQAAFEFTIQSVNRKNLDLQIYLPSEWSDLEPKIAEWSKKIARRGRISIHLRADKKKSKSKQFNLNRNFIKTTLNELKAISEEHSGELIIDANTLLKINQIYKDQETLPDWTKEKEKIEKSFNFALNEWHKMRCNEGKALNIDIKKRISFISIITKEISHISANSTIDYAKALRDRLNSMNLEIDLNDERLLKELAIFSDRSDISEELTRIESHLSQFNELLDSRELIGRKMDFICIELFREINTISSKTNQLDVTQKILDCKNELERIREQIQNVE